MNATVPKIWAIGGGKGGVGKSTLSLILAFWLARAGKRTILMDVDLGGANVHTLMGITTPVRTLNDYLKRRYDTLEEICIDTEVENLRIICGGGTFYHWQTRTLRRRQKSYRISTSSRLITWC